MYPEASQFWQVFLRRRLYHDFSTSGDAPQRRSQPVRIAVLEDDGADLAAALPTIIELADECGLHNVV